MTWESMPVVVDDAADVQQAIIDRVAELHPNREVLQTESGIGVPSAIGSMIAFNNARYDYVELRGS